MPPIKDARRLGLVEVSVDENRRVRLDLYPPRQQPVDLQLPPDDARGLARGLLEAADAADQAGECAGGHDGA